MDIKNALRYLAKSGLCLLACVVLLGPLMAANSYMLGLFVLLVMTGILGLGIANIAVFVGKVMKK